MRKKSDSSPPRKSRLQARATTWTPTQQSVGGQTAWSIHADRHGHNSPVSSFADIPWLRAKLKEGPR